MSYQHALWMAAQDAIREGRNDDAQFYLERLHFTQGTRPRNEGNKEDDDEYMSIDKHLGGRVTS